MTDNKINQSATPTTPTATPKAPRAPRRDKGIARGPKTKPGRVVFDSNEDLTTFTVEELGQALTRVAELGTRLREEVERREDALAKLRGIYGPTAALEVAK